MQHIQGGDRNQTLLLPVAVDDYVGRENPVRFIEAFVGQCDLQEAGLRRVQPKDTGRPGYDPADLLKLYIYGYVNQVRSSRAARGGDRTQSGSNLAAAWLAPRLQDHRGFSQGQPTCLQDCLPSIRAPLPQAGPVRTRTACRRR